MGTTLASTRRVSFATAQTPAVVMGDLTLVRSLAIAGIPSVVVTTDPRDITLHSRHALGHCVVDGFDARAAERTLADLMDLAARLAPRAGGGAHGSAPAPIPLFYGTDAQLAFVQAHRAVLAERYGLLLNDDAVAAALLDKGAFYGLAVRAGVPVPRTARADDPAAVRALRAPVLVKPRTKVAWKALQKELFGGAGKARVFEDLDALATSPALLAHASELVVQEHVRGDVDSLHSFHGFADEDGELLGAFSGHKIRTYPRVAGESSFIELTLDADVLALGRDVTRRLGLRGVFKIDLIRESGRLFVLEVNARYNLWNYLGAVHGVNLPAIAYEHLVHHRHAERPPGYAPRYRWLNLYRDALALRDGRRDGSLGVLRWAASLARQRKVYEAFAWTDPVPFAFWAADYLRRKVSASSSSRGGSGLTSGRPGAAPP